MNNFLESKIDAEAFLNNLEESVNNWKAYWVDDEEIFLDDFTIITLPDNPSKKDIVLALRKEDVTIHPADIAEPTLQGNEKSFYIYSWNHKQTFMYFEKI